MTAPIDRRRLGVAARWPIAFATVLSAATLAACSAGGSPAGGSQTSEGGTGAVPTAAPSGARSSTSAHASRSSTAAKVAAADRTHEVPTPAPAERVAGGWRTPAEAVYVFANRYINWNAANVSAQLRALASVSVGQARSAMTQAASGTASDYELRQGGVSNAGQVQSIAPIAGARHQYAVVTRERTTATDTDAYQGLTPEWHLALATVTRTHGGLWVLSGWRPES